MKKLILPLIEIRALLKAISDFGFLKQFVTFDADGQKVTGIFLVSTYQSTSNILTRHQHCPT
jgi:hypothetical protein